MTDDLSRAIATIKRLGSGYTALAIQELIGPAAKEIAELQNEAPYGETPYSFTVAAFDNYKSAARLGFWARDPEAERLIDRVEEAKLKLLKLIDIISERQV